MDGQWLTYTEAGELLKCSPDAIRRRALRAHWGRQLGNDGRARILVPEGASEALAHRSATAVESAAGQVLALQAHIVTLKEQLGAAETRIEDMAGELAGERAARQAEHAQASAARTAADTATAELNVERTARQVDREQLAAARAAADQAIGELVALAKRLAAIAEADPEPPRRSAAGRAWRWFLRN
jgi:hypothetical protein